MPDEGARHHAGRNMMRTPHNDENVVVERFSTDLETKKSDDVKSQNPAALT